jgi:hypothetical protein
MWTIALYGTDTSHQLDPDGELALSELPPNPATNNEWLKVSIYGASPTYNDESSSVDTPGGYHIERAVLRRQLKLQLETITFPSEMGIIETLKALKLNKEIYLYNIDYPVALHKIDYPTAGVDYAVRINIKTSVEDDYANGEKNITLEIVKTKVE